MQNCISTTGNCHSHIHESTHFILSVFLMVHPRCFPRLACGPPKITGPGAPPRLTPLSVGLCNWPSHILLDSSILIWQLNQLNCFRFTVEKNTRHKTLCLTYAFNRDYLHKILLIEPTDDPYNQHRITDVYVKC